ncbi:MAG: hypothetical protein ACYC5M_00910 [Anaerolineae bacterium]
MRPRHSWFFYVLTLVYSAGLMLLGLDQWELWVITLSIFYLSWALRR